MLVFVATQALPGDPAPQILGHAAAPDQLAALRTELGLDGRCSPSTSTGSAAFCSGDLGTSLATPRVGGLELISDRGAQLARARAAARPGSRSRSRSLIGTLAAVRRDRPFDHVSQLVLLVLTALPEFVIGLGLLLLLATRSSTRCRRSR